MSTTVKHAFRTLLLTFGMRAIFVLVPFEMADVFPFRPSVASREGTPSSIVSQLSRDEAVALDPSSSYEGVPSEGVRVLSGQSLISSRHAVTSKTSSVPDLKLLSPSFEVLET